MARTGLPKSPQPPGFFDRTVTDDAQKKIAKPDAQLRAEIKLYDEFTERQYNFINRISIGIISSYVLILGFIYRSVNTSSPGDMTSSVQFEAWHITGFLVGILPFVIAIALFRYVNYLIFASRKLKQEIISSDQTHDVQNIKTDLDSQIKKCQLLAWIVFGLAILITVGMLLFMGADIQNKL